VLAGETDRGVVAAVVYLTTEPMTWDPPFALTDGTGRFTFDKLPAGTYRISVMPPEHSGRFVSSDDRVASIDLDAAKTVEIPPVRLPFGASVSGQVVDDRGEPMANVQIYALADEPGNPQRGRVGSPFCRTDDLGRYRLFGLRAGIVLIAATAENSMRGSDSWAQARLVLTYFPDAVTESQATPLTVRPGSDVEGIDIRMARLRTCRVSGTATDSRGLPYRGDLGFRRKTVDGSSIAHIPIKAEGSFEVTGIVPGSYAIVAGDYGGGAFEREKTGQYANLPVEVTDGDVEGLMVVTKPTVDLAVRVEFEPGLTTRGGTVAGTISDEKGAPVRDQVVVLFPLDRSRWTMESSGVLSGRSDKDGLYRIRGVRAGQYRVTAIDRASLNRLYTDRASLLESLFDAATPVTVGEDEQRQVDLRVVR
jgi:hypothetical protein